MRLIQHTRSVLVGALIATSAPFAFSAEDALQAAVDNPHRSEKNVARDQYRHPYETLSFLGLQPDMTIVEIWPGSGWYSEILGPFTAKEGRLIAAGYPQGSEVAFFNTANQAFADKIAAEKDAYATTEMTQFNVAVPLLDVPDESVDAVVTFRNVHNWMRDKKELGAFTEFFRAIKPGGLLGVVEHRAPEGRSHEDMVSSGYVTEAHVIALAEEAGFVLEEKSEVNANPKDSADHPKGVWTLPPQYRLGDVDRDKYSAIGESDRMTLRFRKPE